MVCGLALGTAVSAQAASVPNLLPQVQGDALKAAEAQRQVLFKKMLADPGNVELALQYAELSSQVGDIEGAISTLERLLIYAPQVAQLNYELGILYLRIGAYEQASTYFKAAVASPDVTPEIKTQAAAYIAVSNKQVVGDYATADFQAGARYQSNANGGVGGSTVTLNGIPFVVNDAAKATPDYNAFLTGNIHASHDLASQGDRLDFDLSLYGSLYRQQTDLNTLAGEIQAGPVFNLERLSIKDTTLGVYGIGSAVSLGGAPYLYVLGAGGVITADPTAATVLHTRLEYRYEDYINSAERPSVSDMTGPRTRLTQDAQVQANDWLGFYGAVYGERKDGRNGINSDWETGASVGTTISFGASDNKKKPMTLDLSAGLTGRMFDAADPVVSTDVRTDKLGYLQAEVTVPIGNIVSAVGTVVYSKQISNYDLHTYDDLSVSLALDKGY